MKASTQLRYTTHSYNRNTVSIPLKHIAANGKHHIMGRVENEAALAQWRAKSYGSFYHYMNHRRRPRQFPEFNNLVVEFRPVITWWPELIPDPSVVPCTRLRAKKLGMEHFSAFQIDHFPPHPSVVPLPLHMLKWHQC